ncbi:MAG TPA: DUF5615 family PIN-like protein [Thermoanaerobaculia bacterium]|nr:DUF5615 family PIN-like protein [Thermoanaerobaculia bacterium]
MVQATALKFLADINISPSTVEDLQRRGWDIERVSRWLDPRTADREILAFARQEGRIVITQDLDFSALLALNGWDRPSLITLRLSGSDPELVTTRILMVAPLLQRLLHEGCAITVEDVAVRVRRLPIR